MFLQRPPIAPLQAFVAQLWASGDVPGAAPAGPVREHMLPTGAMHLVFRLAGGTLRVSGPGDAAQGRTAQGALMGLALVGGARSSYYRRELQGPSCSVGAVLRPGAAQCLLGESADALAERHTALEDLWGSGANTVHDRLCAAPSPAARLAVLEQVLLARVQLVGAARSRQPLVRGMHPGVAAVLQRLQPSHTVEAAVHHSGLSHRQFVLQFRRAVGLAPKTYLRVLRFQQTLRSMAQGGPDPTGGRLAAMAADAGYADQAHFSRDFLALSGVSPGAYLRLAPQDANHLPMSAL